jgi:hypothetical protein
MARIAEPENSWHLIRIISDHKDGEVLLVRGKKLAYLWVGKNPGAEPGCVTIGGVKTLRKLARAILDEVGKYIS